MSFVLVSKRGELQVNAWNWRPTLELLLAENVLVDEQFERLGENSCGGRVDAYTANKIADAVERWVADMKPGERMLPDLTVTSSKREPVVWTPNGDIEGDTKGLYSASYEWLVVFRDFCRQSEGFEIF